MARTTLDFSKHELIITNNDNILIHHLKIPETVIHNIKFINTNDVMVVTGDFGNWVFCREFHPSEDGYVSDGYWLEKLRNSSTQVHSEYSAVATKKRILELLKEEECLTEEEKDYLKECMDNLYNCELDYSYFAYRNNVGRFEDSEYVPFEEEINPWLLYIFDGFEEICKRMKDNKNEEKNISDYAN
jgi:hypothetical protein